MTERLTDRQTKSPSCLRFLDGLAKKLIVEAPHAAIPFTPGTSDHMPGSVTLQHSSKVALQRNILEAELLCGATVV